MLLLNRICRIIWKSKEAGQFLTGTNCQNPLTHNLIREVPVQVKRSFIRWRRLEMLANPQRKTGPRVAKYIS
jgi:hypothetical protein